MRALVVGSIVAVGAGVGVWAVTRRETPPEVHRPTMTGEYVDQLGEMWALIERANKAVGADRTAAIAAARAKVRAIETNHGDDPDLPFARGLVEVMAHAEADAQAAYGRLASIAKGGPKDRRACYLRSIHLLEFDRERAEEAVVLLRAVRQQSPGFMTEPVERALFRALITFHLKLLERGQGDRAIDALNEALAVVGEKSALGAEARFARAFAYGNADRWVECERAWRELIEESHGRAAAPRFQLAGALAVQNRAADAEAEYTAVLALLDEGKQPAAQIPLLREARLRRGNCRRVLGKHAEARADIEAYLVQKPDDYRAEYWLGVLLIDGFEKPAEAEPHLLKAHAAAPFCDTYLRQLVTLYETLLPDPAKAAPLREEYETKKKERAAERARLVKTESPDSFLCD